MNDETLKALKRLMKHATQGGARDKAFWGDVEQVESWISETEYK